MKYSRSKGNPINNTTDDLDYLSFSETFIIKNPSN